MTALQPVYLLDTNILLAYVRYGLIGQYIEKMYGLYTMQPSPIISVVTEGEIRALALKRNWGTAKLADLQRLLNSLTIVPLPFRNSIDGYALSKNDLWIAATAHVTGARVLTTDRDFDPLHGLFLQRDWINPASRP